MGISIIQSSAPLPRRKINASTNPASAVGARNLHGADVADPALCTTSKARDAVDWSRAWTNQWLRDSPRATVLTNQEGQSWIQSMLHWVEEGLGMQAWVLDPAGHYYDDRADRHVHASLKTYLVIRSICCDWHSEVSHFNPVVAFLGRLEQYIIGKRAQYSIEIKHSMQRAIFIPPPPPPNVRCMNVSFYERTAFTMYPQLLKKLNEKLPQLITCKLGKTGPNVGVVLTGCTGEANFQLSYSIVEHFIRDFGEEFEFNKTFRFNNDHTRDNAIDTLNIFGQSAFHGGDGHTALNITSAGMAHLRILRGTTTYMKGVATVVKTVLNCALVV